MRFNIAKESSGRSVTAVLGSGKVLVADSKHPNWDEIVDELINKEPTDSRVQELFDVSFVLGQKFDALGDRLTVSNGRIYLDYAEIDDDLTKEILRYYVEGNKDLTGLVAFFHKMITNPNPGSVQFLYSWLKRGSWSICDDGDFIGYKNVEKDTYLSFTVGKAIVDGVMVEGRIPNKPGSIVEMPRNEVVDKSGGACATGLHVGTFEFASSYHTLVGNGGNGVLVKVKMNPVNVVSVPAEQGVAKMRVCKYVVLDETAEENATPHEPQANLDKHPAASNDDGFAKYIDFKAGDFEKMTRMDMRVLSKAWKVGTVRTNKPDMVTLFAAEAKKRRKARGE